MASSREQTARCDACGKIGHFKKNCPTHSYQQKRRDRPTLCCFCQQPWSQCLRFQKILPEIAASLALLNEEQIKSFIERCGGEGKNRKFEILMSAQRGQPQIQITLCLIAPQVNAVKGYLQGPFEGSGTRHMAEGHNPFFSCANTKVPPEILVRLERCHDAESLIKVIKSFPVFESMSCNFRSTTLREMANFLTQRGVIDSEHFAEDKRSGLNCLRITRIREDHVNLTDLFNSQKVHGHLKRLYGEEMNLSPEQVEKLLVDVHSVPIQYRQPVNE